MSSKPLGKNAMREPKFSSVEAKGFSLSRSASGTLVTPPLWLSTSTALERELPKSSTSETPTAG